MKQLPSPDQHELTVGNVPSTEQREIIGNQVDLPGRFPILTDGIMHDLINELDYLLGAQDSIDARNIGPLVDRIKSFVRASREKLKKDGRNLRDWKYTVVMAVHHKGQATDFWLGDRPDVEKVDKSLDKHMRKPVTAERVQITKA